MQHSTLWVHSRRCSYAVSHVGESATMEQNPECNMGRLSRYQFWPSTFGRSHYLSSTLLTSSHVRFSGNRHTSSLMLSSLCCKLTLSACCCNLHNRSFGTHREWLHSACNITRPATLCWTRTGRPVIRLLAAASTADGRCHAKQCAGKLQAASPLCWQAAHLVASAGAAEAFLSATQAQLVLSKLLPLACCYRLGTHDVMHSTGRSFAL